MNKYVFNVGEYIIIVCAVLVIMMLGFSNAKVSNYQATAISCFQSGDLESKACLKMPMFGVAPSLYIKDDIYRKKVDLEYLRAGELISKAAPMVAKYTLDYGVKKSIRFSAKVYKKISELIV